MTKVRNPWARCLVSGALAVAGVCVGQVGCAGPREPDPVRHALLPSAALAEAVPEVPIWGFVPLRDSPSAGEQGRSDAGLQAAFLRCQDHLRSHPDDGLAFCLSQHGYYPALCSDGRDNDGDGRIDHGDDPGCRWPESLREDPACDDGRDNDGDGLIDAAGSPNGHPDPDCEHAWGTQEHSKPKRFGLP